MEVLASSYAVPGIWGPVNASDSHQSPRGTLKHSLFLAGTWEQHLDPIVLMASPIALNTSCPCPQGLGRHLMLRRP